MKTLKPNKKLAILAIIYLSLISSFGLFAQELKFARSFGGSFAEQITDIEVDGNGNIYTIGVFRGTMDVDPGAGVTNLTAPNGDALFLIKSNLNGGLIWAKQFASGSPQFGSSVRYLGAKMELDASGNIFIAGNFNYTADFDPGEGVTTLTPAGNDGESDIFFARFASNGNLVWVKQLRGDEDDFANDIALDASGNIYITGSFQSTVDFDPGAGTQNRTRTIESSNAFWAKYTSQGDYLGANILFVGQSGTPMKEASSIAVSGIGDIFIGGYYELGNNIKQAYLINLNSGLGLKRDWQYNSSGNSEVEDIAFEADGDFYITGYFVGNLGVDNNLSIGSSDVFISYFLNRNDNGVRLWTESFGGTGSDAPYSMEIGPNEEAYVVGMSSGVVDYDPGEGELLLSGNTFITALDEDGNLFRSAKVLEDVSGYNNGAVNVPGGFNTIATGNGKIYVGGASDVAFDIDPSEDERIITPNGQSDVFFAVFTPEPEVIAYSLDENSPNGTVVGNIRTYGQSNYPFPNIQSGNTDGAFELGEFGSQNELKILVANSSVLDFETNPSYTLRISQGTDDGGSVAALYEISLNDLVEGPEISDQSFTIISTIENGDAVGTISATNSTGDPINVTINSGNTNDAFELDILTRVLTVADASLLDFSTPNSYILNVTAQDASGSNSADITIILNTAPTFDWTSTTLSFDENDNWLQGVPVADADEDALTVTIESGDPDDVLILANNAGVGAGFELWEISPKSGEGIDFESYESFELVIRAEDALGNITLSEPITININNLNDNTPTLSDQTISISEGLPNGSSVVTIEGSDLDGDNLTYSIVLGNTDDAFLLDETTGELFVGNVEALVFDTNPVFALSVTVSDGATSATATLTINLVQSPAPIINDQTFSIISTIVDTDEVGTIEAVDPQGDAITFAITTGNTDNVFALNETTGVLTLINRSALDFTTANSYTLTVSASDGTDSNSAEITVILNTAPVYDFQTASFSFDENTQWPLLIPVTDPEGDEITVTIESGNTDGVLNLENTANASNGMPVADAWEIFPATAAGIDFEVYESFELVIKAEDAFGNITLSDPITININNVNDNAPTVTDETVAISEGTPNGSAVTTVVGADLDNDPLTYTITSGNTDDAFALNAGSGELTVNNVDALVFATNPTFSLVVNVSDGASSSNATITINLSEASGPVIVDQTFNVISSIATGDEVGTVIAVDAQGDPITYTILSGNTNNAFSLDASTGVLTVSDRSQLDFSSSFTFVLNIAVNDERDTNTANVSVILNTAPVFNWTATSFNFDENAQWFLTVPVSDPESDNITPSIVSGNTDNLLSIANTAPAGSPAVYQIFPAAQGIDFEQGPISFDLVIEATDVFTNTTTSESITVNINNVNDNAPTVSDATVEISEGLPNGSAVTTIQASDLDNNQLAYFITSGNTNNAFTINTGTGELTVGNSAALVFVTNPTFSLGINVTDGTLSSSATITINLSEAAAPVIEEQSFDIVSGISTGDEVGTVEAFDAQGDAITYSITSGNSNDAFELDATTGLLKVADRDALDFSSPNSFALVISVSDQSGSNSATITIVLNTSPVFNWTTTAFDFDENEQWFLTIPVSDGEEDVLTFTITSGNESSLISIVNTASAGADPVYEITPSAQSIDFEVDQTSFELSIDVTDDAGNTTTSESISISINNVNDNAPETGNKTVAINQNLPNGQAVTTVTGSDADGDELTFVIESGNTDDAFVIDETTGDITVSNSSALVFDTNPTFALSVGVSDGVFTTTASITVNLNEQAVNTAPLISDQTFTLLENSENGTSVATIEASDLEGDALTFAIISGNTSNAFLLTSSSGQLIVTNSEMLDFETNPSFSLLVSVSDGSLTETATVTIELEDVDEGSVLGFDDSKKILKIYPNPASNYFQLSLNDEANIKRVVLLDESGKTIRFYSLMINHQYSLDGIKDGIYFLMIETEDSTSSNKLIIRK